MFLRWLRIGITAAILVAALVVAPSCRKADADRRIEIWISAKNTPHIRVYTNEWWTYGSDLRVFSAKLGPGLGKTHTILNGELAWSDADKSQAVFTYELENSYPVTVTILGVTETTEASAASDPKLTIVYQPGKHSFKKMLWVKYTYD